MKAPVLKKVLNLKDWRRQINDWMVGQIDLIAEKEINISDKEFELLCNDFLVLRYYIAENLDEMWIDEKGWHCIVVQSENSDIVIYIQSNNTDYAYYTSIIYKQEYKQQYRLRAYCNDCPDKINCIHKDAFRRMPKEIGGLGLCPKLKDGADPRWKI